jgi:hypothetical protein
MGTGSGGSTGTGAVEGPEGGRLGGVGPTTPGPTTTGGLTAVAVFVPLLTTPPVA